MAPRIEVAIHANLARMLRNGELDLLEVGESYREKGLVSRTIVAVARRVMDLLIEVGNSSDSGHDQGRSR